MNNNPIKKAFQNRKFIVNNSSGRYNLLYYINQIACIMFCIWMCWPYFAVKTRTYAALVFLIVWFFTTDFRWLTKKWSMDLILTIVFFITFVPYILSGNLMFGGIGSSAILIRFPLFFVGIFINHYYMYYKKDLGTLGRIAFISIFMYIIGSIQTIQGLKQFPMAARALATGRDPMGEFYTSLGIGSFGYVYSAVFVAIAVLFLVIKKVPGMNKYYRLLSTISFVSILLMIIEASYTIALMLSFIGIILVIVFKKKRSLMIASFFALVFILIFPKDIIGNIILNIAHLFKGSYVVREKLTDFARGFLGEGMGVQTYGRLQKYLMSLNTFFKNPVFGIYGPFGNPYDRIGGHSGWFDLMGFYGIFASLPMFSAIILIFRKQLSFYSDHPYYLFLLIAQLMFIFFGFINPVVYVYRIGFALFVIIPSLPFLPYAFRTRRNMRTIKNNA